MISSSNSKIVIIYITALLFIMHGHITAQHHSPIPAVSSQLIVVVTNSATAVKGTLCCFERKIPGGEWEKSFEEFPVVLGRNGLGWGNGLHKIPADSGLPIKKEGDGKSPAGVFSLGAIFGYKAADKMKNLKMPYIPVTEMTECIDDVNSQLYNQIVDKDKVNSVDWNSSEKMRKMGIYYELGVIVEHNTNPVIRGSGSCIFLHNWSNPDETMAGCTAMAPENLKKIVYDLDANREPVLVQLTIDLYNSLTPTWDLPKLNK